MVTETEMFESPNLIRRFFKMHGATIKVLDSCLWDWMNSKVYERQVDMRDKLLARILDAATCTKNREVRLRRTSRDLRTRFGKCTEVDGGIFEYLL
jgi:hypothetical protein